MVKKIILALYLIIFSPLTMAKFWLIDNAGVLDIAVKNKLEQKLNIINAKTNSQSFIVLEKFTNQDEQRVADDLFDELSSFKVGKNVEGTLFLIITQDAAGQGRRIYLTTSGDKTISKINDRVINKLINNFAEDMRYNNYNYALENYVAQLDKNISDNALSNEDAAGGGLAALISSLIAFFSTKRRYKVGKCEIPALWKANTTSEFSDFKNNLISSDTRIRIIPNNTNRITGNSGRSSSSTHYSSSGNRHGGGGRGF